MTLSNARAAYIDCYELMDKALADPVGCRAPMKDWETASAFRLRLNYARRLDREQNALIYEAEHPMHGQSPYNMLTARIKTIGGRVWLYLERTNGAIAEEAELLSEVIDDSPNQARDVEGMAGPLREAVPAVDEIDERQDGGATNVRRRF